MDLIYADAETYSEAPLDRVGARLYARHPSTRVRFWSFAHPRLKPRGVAVTGEPDLWHAALRTGLVCSTGNAPVVFVHWGAFDRWIAEAFAREGSPFWRVHPELRPDLLPMALWYGDVGLLDLRQRCLMVGGPAKLELAAEWCGTRKHVAVRSFMTPQQGRMLEPAEAPEKWKKFVAYGRQDTAVLHPIAQRVGPVSGPEINGGAWGVVERMNARGFSVDTASVERAKEILEAAEPAIVERFVRLTGGIRPTQVQKVAAYLGTPNCKKETLEALIAGRPKTSKKRLLAEIRLEVGGATRHKLRPLLETAGPDGRCRDQFTYYGAWTRRLTAQGTQPQNFYGMKEDEGDYIRGRDAFFAALRSREEWTKDHPNIFESVKRYIRGFIVAPINRVLVSADFSQIELRVMAWLAGEHWLLDALHAGTDVYKITAGNLFGRKPATVDDMQRKLGKVVELASQFGLSGAGKDGRGGLRAKARESNIALTINQAEEMIRIYRKSHPKIVSFWTNLDDAIKRVVLTGRTVRCGRILIDHPHRDLVRIIRPSGHYQCLWEPRFEGDEYKSTVTYIGRLKNGSMGRVSSYGSRFAQGVTQGTAADLLFHGMEVAERAGYPPVLSIHDEIVSEPIDDGSDHVDRLCKLYTENLPAWAKGIPVKAEGWQSKRFQ